MVSMPVADPRDEERVGSVLHGKWTLERLLGVGGMGSVYAARHRNGARAAVKVLSVMASRHPHIRTRFLREGYAANRVEHSGAVRVLDDDVIAEGPDEGTAYLVMELLEGESLSDRAKRQPPLVERDLLEIADGLLAVLVAAHEHGVVHRDLKPDNLFLVRATAEDGNDERVQIKVLDFGLARLLETQEQTIAGMALGTPTYMSPEQAAGHVDQIDGRTDIYALGSILFQLTTNKRIHDAAHTLGLVVRMATTPAPKLNTVAPDASEAFCRIVDRALEFKREDRYRTAASMRADVKAALAQRTVAEESTVHAVPASLRHPAQPAPPPPKTGARPVEAPPAAPESVAASIGPRKQQDTRPFPKPRAAGPPSAAAREDELPSSFDDRPARRSWLGTLAVFCFAGLGLLAAWRNWPTIERTIFAGTNPSASASPALPDAAVLAPGLALPDAAVLAPEVPSPLDASIVEADASTAQTPVEIDDIADASVDGGDDDDDDDDDDDWDGGIDASAVLRFAQSSGQHRPAHGHSAKPHRTKAPRRPGQPRRRKRWHW
jgi:eukaryotic-like serine/threonine-protein kinase